jgi:hypothetical protein
VVEYIEKNPPVFTTKNRKVLNIIIKVGVIMVVYFRVIRSGIDKEVCKGKEGRAWEDKVGKGEWKGVRGERGGY